MNKKILKIILYIAGIICIAYPICSKYISYRNQTNTIYDYNEQISNRNQDEIQDTYDKAEEFNNNIATDSRVIDVTQADNESTSVYKYNFLEVGQMIGYISIPKINIEIPIYEGVDNNNLLRGVAHLENTSLPNGQLSTHSVLAGHTGISQAEIFDNIDQLDLDDVFYVTFLDNTYEYKVIDKNIVVPDDTSNLKIEDGRCLVTLVTCTPKTVNSHRLLITGEKVQNYNNDDNTEQNIQQDTEINTTTSMSELNILINFIKNNIYIPIIIIILLLLLIFVIIRNRKKKKYRGGYNEKDWH